MVHFFLPFGNEIRETIRGEIIRRDDFLGGRVFDCSSSKSRGEEEVEEGGVSASILAPPPEIQAGLD